MAVTQTNNGTQSATLDTEHTLATITTAGVYVLRVNLNNLANADRVVLRAKTKVLSTSSSLLEFSAAFEHAQADKVAVSIPIPVVHELIFTLEQTDGTARSFEWSVLNLQG